MTTATSTHAGQQSPYAAHWAEKVNLHLLAEKRFTMVLQIFVSA